MYQNAESMSEGLLDSEHPDTHAPEDVADERFLVRNPLQVRQLLRSLIDQRAMINAHIGGRDQGFPTAVLDLDEDEDVMLLDGSPVEAANRAAEAEGHLLCFAQLEKVMVRFRVDNLQRVDNGPHVAFRASLPEEVMHLQRREMYRLETPITDSPHLLLPMADGRGEALSMRVVDISGGGLAVNIPADIHVFGMQRRYEAELSIPEGPDLQVSLIACNERQLKLPNGMEATRIGLRFDRLPRGGDSAIQRYIFRIDRQRSARRNGE